MINPLHAGQTWSSGPFTFSSTHPHHLASSEAAEPTTRTQQPIVTGTSVLGLRYKNGIMLASDTLASYGSLARFMDVRRLHALGDNTVIGMSGDLSDMQYLLHEVDKIL